MPALKYGVIFSLHFLILIDFRFQDFHLCQMCKDEIGHEHKMEKFGLDLDEESSLNHLDQTQAAPIHPLQAWINLIPHAERCQDQQCNQTMCNELKEYMAHAKSCAHAGNGECIGCSQLEHMYSRHAKQCNQAECVVSYCLKYKECLVRHRIKQEVTLNRRVLFIDTEEAIDF